MGAEATPGAGGLRTRAAAAGCVDLILAWLDPRTRVSES